mmetsp:Transcript_48655/g.137563  ORF Transcript_48655/g.137563 Transcript_48655/m.137563 type:complete len:239 (-) Transcript_48655:1020-1736(-)
MSSCTRPSTASAPWAPLRSGTSKWCCWYSSPARRWARCRSGPASSTSGPCSRSGAVSCTRPASWSGRTTGGTSVRSTAAALCACRGRAGACPAPWRAWAAWASPASPSSVCPSPGSGGRQGRSWAGGRAKAGPTLAVNFSWTGPPGTPRPRPTRGSWCWLQGDQASSGATSWSCCWSSATRSGSSTASRRATCCSWTSATPASSSTTVTSWTCRRSGAQWSACEGSFTSVLRARCCLR